MRKHFYVHVLHKGAKDWRVIGDGFADSSECAVSKCKHALIANNEKLDQDGVTKVFNPKTDQLKAVECKGCIICTPNEAGK